MNWNNAIRQVHRWLSIAFTVAATGNIAALGQKEPAVWVGLLALLPLALLLLTGLYLFVLPYAAKRRIAWRTGLYRVGVDGGIFLGPFLSGVLGMRLAGLLPALSTAALAVTALLLLARARSSGTMAIHG